MAPLRVYSQWANRSFQKISRQQHNPWALEPQLLTYHVDAAQTNRSYATKTSSPLVHVRPPASPIVQQTSGLARPARSTRPSPSSEKSTVYAPYVRITLGIIFCGSLVYSMVASPPFSFATSTYQSLRSLVDQLPHKTARIPHHCRPRPPHKARIRHRALVTYASAHGIFYSGAAERNCPDARTA